MTETDLHRTASELHAALTLLPDTAEADLAKIVTAMRACYLQGRAAARATRPRRLSARRLLRLALVSWVGGALGFRTVLAERGRP